MKPVNHWDYLAGLVSLNVTVAIMAAEAVSVMSMRLMGFAGVWSIPPTEAWQMVDEKGRAMTRAHGNAAEAMLRGKAPTDIASAAMVPFRSATRFNSRRLASRGLKKH
ncbi:antifreeze protein [Sagittula salina]|uniref:Antifreeze protein n=1 Tax=Sagittula salina TaxID=2820268 RepID=A0A940S0V9_9RHOB|nr:antifreeze protein [Sagittula salina]MBP0482496.1 antifreeze protein [Sagittula salina]